MHDSTKHEGELIAYDTNELKLSDKVKNKIEGKKKKEWVELIHTLEMKDVKETKIVISFK